MTMKSSLKHLLLPAFCLLICLVSRAQTAIGNGKCGDNLIWTLFDTGELIISGEGDMTDFRYTLDDSTAPWYGNRASITSVTINMGVTSIGNFAFSDCTSLRSISIPKSINRIGLNAFSCCSSLTDITIPEKVTIIGSTAFQNCSSLTNITLCEGVGEIGNLTFQYCTSLTSIYIPASVNSIGAFAFLGDSSLDCIEVDSNNAVYDSREGCNAIIHSASNNLLTGCKNTVIPDGITSIGSYAFSSCTSLESINIPASVTYIRENAFSHCNSLHTISFPKNSSLTHIGDGGFEDCSTLSRIDIPANVINIGEKAFAGCSALKEIHSLSPKPPRAEQNTFTDVDVEHTVLFVPEGSVKDYSYAFGWEQFTNIVEEKTTSLAPPTINSSEPIVYNMQGMPTSPYAKGIYIEERKIKLRF